VLVVLGSANRPKLAATSAVFQRLYPGAEVRPVEVRVDVPAQPIGDVQTQQGAILRARAALEKERADFGVGMEGGLRETLTGWALCLWAAVVEWGPCSPSRSSSFLPRPLRPLLRAR